MPRSEAQRVRERLHAERLERSLTRLKEEVAEAERSYNGQGEAQVVLGMQLSGILKEWKEQFKIEHPRYQGGSPFEEIVMGPNDWLKEHTGLHIRRVQGLINGEFPTVSLTQAEVCLMAIGQEHLLSNGTIHIIPNPGWSLDRWIDYMSERGCI